MAIEIHEIYELFLNENIDHLVLFATQFDIDSLNPHKKPRKNLEPIELWIEVKENIQLNLNNFPKFYMDRDFDFFISKNGVKGKKKKLKIHNNASFGENIYFFETYYEAISYWNRKKDFYINLLKKEILDIENLIDKYESEKISLKD